MRASVKFLDHVINHNSVSVDPAKVDIITKMSKADLLEVDRCMPSAKRIKSFLGIFYQQHFIANCSSVAKPLFILTAGQKRRGKTNADSGAGTYHRVKATDWMLKCDAGFINLKECFLNSVVLTHPDLSHPLILSIDASLDGLSAVYPKCLLVKRKCVPLLLQPSL